MPTKEQYIKALSIEYREHPAGHKSQWMASFDGFTHKRLRAYYSFYRNYNRTERGFPPRTVFRDNQMVVNYI